MFYNLSTKSTMHVAFLRHDSSDESTEIITQLSPQQCAGSSQTHIIPRVELSKSEFDKQKRAKHQTKGSCSSEWDSRTVLLYWSSLVDY